MEKNSEQISKEEHLKQLGEAVWEAFRNHWNNVLPRGNYNEALESGKTVLELQKKFEEAGGSWEEFKNRKEKEMIEKAAAARKGQQK